MNRLAFRIIIAYTIAYYSSLSFFTHPSVRMISSAFFSIGGALLATIWLWKAHRRIRTKESTFWGMLTVSMICYVIAESIYRVYGIVYDAEPPFPSWPDVFYLGNSFLYILSLCYMMMFLRKQWKMWQALFDTLIVTTMLAIYSWLYVVQPLFHSQVSIAYVLVLLSYPLLDFAITFFLLLVIFLTRLNRIWMLNLFGIGLFVFVDTMYFIQMMQFEFVSNSWLDPLWGMSLLFIGSSGMYAKEGDITIQVTETTRWKSNVKIFFPYASLVPLFYAFFRFPSDHIVIAGVVVTVCFVVIRQWLTLHENRHLVQCLQTLNHELEKKVDMRTNELQRVNEQLTYAANHDFLTGLPNRRAFIQSLEEALQQAKQQRHSLAVLYIDVDRFKQINDYFGHAVGDQLIVEIGQLLKQKVRPTHVVARQGGDEFTIIVTPVYHLHDVYQLVDDIVSISKQPIAVQHLDIRVSLSVGVAMYPYDGETSDTLMKHADMAMYRAKEQGKNQYQFFNGEMDRTVSQKTMIETDLYEAIEQKQFVLFYQPQFDVKTKKLIGMEALIRWIHPKLGMISPGVFIPIAEETGQIIAIGEWVIEEACRQIKRWNEQTGLSLRMSVNISPKQFLKENFVEHIDVVLRETSLPAHQLDLEITEGVAVFNEQYTIHKLQQLKRIGVCISIDDFGTGYSSLSYLRKFPIDRLKIAKPFIDGMTEEEEDVAVVKAIIVLAQNLKLRVIAEGVETLSQFHILETLQCDEIQGYVFGKPLDADAFENTYLQNQLPNE
ncbi:putative bifunctional diguanylate cyclase/phosphodiesterase [Anoxybacillus flavithermus]|uniref:Diguanylate cyclase n=1 Tax=Anoxybacillus flavithermus AK1 TaxID=1297581 RepID=M8CTI5_9BACL|nr:EAL domain-containing protein [Anoxybacillus flavithermus]EMT44843.1 diguanylate cyclase [Anoxybacillus flavithermus AK1]